MVGEVREVFTSVAGEEAAGDRTATDADFHLQLEKEAIENGSI